MSDFKAVILEEETAPSHAIACQQCELSKQRHRVIWGEGNPEAPIFIIMDNPGAREDKEGQAFVCGTRETLQVGMREAGLGIGMVYVSYLLKCRPIRAYNKPIAREACSSHLKLQLEEKKPSLLFGLGNVVVDSIFPDVGADIKSFRGRWHTFQGLPIAFSYHPLAVRRRPVLMNYFVQDVQLITQRIKEMT